MITYTVMPKAKKRFYIWFLFIFFTMLLSIGHISVAAPGELLLSIFNPSPANQDRFGISVTSIGSNILVGSELDNGGANVAGEVYMFNAITGDLMNIFDNPYPASFDRFGLHIATVDNNVLVGVPLDDTIGKDTGIAYLYDSATGEVIQTFYNPSAQPVEGNFGFAVAALENNVLVGAPHDKSFLSNAGAAYLFDGSTGNLLQTFQKLNPKVQDQFGYSIAGEENKALIGAKLDSTKAAAAGAAYLFDANTGDLLHAFFSPNPVPYGEFGTTVAIKSNKILISAPTGSENKVYLFDALTGELINTFSSGTSSYSFGKSVAFVGDNVLIGSPDDDRAGQRTGSVFLYNGSTGELLHVFLNPTPAFLDNFGISVSAHNSNILIGANRDDTGASNSGAVYLFKGLNKAPIANAGNDITIFASEIPDTIIQGTASDGDQDDTLLYRWLEEETILLDWTPVVTNGECPLNLNTTSIGIGTHTLTLEVSDDQATASDDMVLTVENSPPNADFVFEQLTNIGSQALVSLDGTGTTDYENSAEDLIYQWKDDGNLICEGFYVDCSTVVTSLDFGSHAVTLRVTDQLGAYDEITKTITVDPAKLSVLNIDKLEVEWGDTPARIKIKEGEIGLPFGVNFSEVAPHVLLEINLADADPSVIPLSQVFFTVEGGHSEKWKFDDKDAIFGIRKFEIDWDGTRYDFKEKDFPVELKSQIITSSETILTLKLKKKNIAGLFSIDFDGKGSIEIDEEGNVFSATIPYEVEKPGKEVTLTLPLPFLYTTDIIFSGSLNRTLLVGDKLKESIGCYTIEAKFDGNIFPDGVDTEPRTFDLAVFFGDQEYSGEVNLGPDDIEIKGNRWKDAK